MKTKALDEIIDLQESVGSANIDEQNGVIGGVVILTGNKRSLNKTLYTDAALKEAVTRYEGAKMYVDHPKSGESNRSIRDLGGHYKNIRLEGNYLKGDLHLLESAKPLIMPLAKARMRGVGLSIKDKGRGSEKDGVFLVEGFASGNSFSIDFVSEVSVNKDLYESRSDNGGTNMELKDLTLDVLKKERPDLVESAQNEGKADVLKQLDEAKQQGQKSEAVELRAQKVLALCEADFSAEVRPKVQAMIEAPEINLASAKAIIKAQKEIVESLVKADANGAPDVTTGKTRSLFEGKKELSDEDWLAACKQ